MRDIATLSLSELSSAIHNGKTTSREAVEACIERISAGADYNNFITVCADAARESADEADKRIRAGHSRGALDGVPVAVKDNISVCGVRVTCGSNALSDCVAREDALPVKKLRAAGAVILGKTNMDEFAMGGTNEYSAFGAVRNALDTRLVSGGSSGGSANCVAAFQAFGALGTDTGGSTRQPSAYCGVVGLKPTTGAVDKTGVIGFAPSLDTVGVIARDAAGAALLLDNITGRSEATSVDRFTDGIKIGVADEFYNAVGADARIIAEFERALCELERSGAKIIRVKIPSFGSALAAYHVISSAEAATVEKRGICSRSVKSLDGKMLLGAEFERRIMTGRMVLTGDGYELYKLACRVRAVIKREYNAALNECDVLVSPTAPTLPPEIGAVSSPHSKHSGDLFASPVSLAGLPAVSIPFGNINGLPIGVQFIGKYYKECDILSAGNRLMEAGG